MVRQVKEIRKHHPHWAALLDWIAVLIATISFVFVALWAAAPDSAEITLQEALFRSATYGVPITLGMWGIARATRRGSAVPPRMSEAMPYARLGKDGKPVASTEKDDEAGNDPTPIGQS